MIYKNSTSTCLELVHGDIRDAEERFVIIGRDASLKNHFESKTENEFRSDLSWLRHTQVEYSRSADRAFAALRVLRRPRSRPQGFEEQVERLRAEVQWPLAHAISWSDAERIAMSPISCRKPEIVAHAMVRMIWCISVAAFLNTKGPLGNVKPKHFRIFSIDGIQPFVDALGSRQVCNIDNGWLFNLDLACSKAKRKRFIDRAGFPFRHLESGRNIVHRRPR